MLHFRWFFFFHIILFAFQASCYAESAKKSMKTQKKSGNLAFQFFLFCMWFCVCMYIGFNAHNFLLAVVLGLRARLYLYYEHLLALVRYEKA